MVGINIDDTTSLSKLRRVQTYYMHGLSSETRKSRCCATVGFRAKENVPDVETVLRVMDVETVLRVMDVETVLRVMDVKTVLRVMDVETVLRVMDVETVLRVMDVETIIYGVRT